MGHKTKKGAKSKPIKPTMAERNIFELRSGGGNINPYAKMADKGLINPLLVTKLGKTKPGDGRLKHAIKTKVDTFKGKTKARRNARTKVENLGTDLAYTSGAGVLAGIGKFLVDVLVHKKPVSGIFAQKMDKR